MELFPTPDWPAMAVMEKESHMLPGTLTTTNKETLAESVNYD